MIRKRENAILGAPQLLNHRDFQILPTLLAESPRRALISVALSDRPIETSYWPLYFPSERVDLFARTCIVHANPHVSILSGVSRGVFGQLPTALDCLPSASSF